MARRRRSESVCPAPTLSQQPAGDCVAESAAAS